MKIVTVVARMLLALPFLVFGLMWFFTEPPSKEGYPPDARAFLEGLDVTGYMWPVVKVIEVAGGALLVAGRYVPLALALLAPLVVNIVLFHAFLHPEGLAIAAPIGLLEAFLIWRYRDAFRGLVAVRT